MNLSRSLLWKIYSAGLGAVTTLVAQKAVHTAWKVATGDTPPDPNDPRTPATEAAIWALASGLGLGVTQLLTNRFLGRRWMALTGEAPPSTPTTKVKVSD